MTSVVAEDDIAFGKNIRPNLFVRFNFKRRRKVHEYKSSAYFYPR